jgi:hypothetical protein
MFGALGLGGRLPLRAVRQHPNGCHLPGGLVAILRKPSADSARRQKGRPSRVVPRPVRAPAAGSAPTAYPEGRYPAAPAVHGFELPAVRLRLRE